MWPHSYTWENSSVWIKAVIKDLNLNQFGVTQEGWILMKNRQTITGITNREKEKADPLSVVCIPKCSTVRRTPGQRALHHNRETKSSRERLAHVRPHPRVGVELLPAKQRGENEHSSLIWIQNDSFKHQGITKTAKVSTINRFRHG